MASISEHRMKEIEAEMDRFEEEISGAPPPPPSSAAPRLIIGSSSTDKKFKDVPVRCEAPKFSAMPPPPPPPVVSVARSGNRQPLAPPPPPPSQPPSFVPPQLRHRLPMPPPPGPPRPPHMSGMRPPPRPPPLGPHLRGMPPRGPPPRGPPPPFMGPPRPPPPMGPHGPMPPPGPPHMGQGPPHMGSGPPRPMAGPPYMGGPPQMGGGGPRGPPPGYMGDPAHMHQQTMEADQGPSATIEKAKVVYAAPVKAADVVKQQLQASGKAKQEDEKEEQSLASGIQVNVPASEIEAEKHKQGEGISSTSMTGPQIVVPEIDVEAFVKKFQAEKAKKEKKKKFIRTAAGQVWEDMSLEEWDPDDFRIFCGDLGNEVTDEVLARAFSRYPTFQKARVVRDKRTNKTKGFGFVSFKDPNDFVKAMREMNGKYVGNRPIKLRKSNWRDRQIDIAKKKDKEKKKLGLR